MGTIRIGAHVLDLDRGTLARDGEPVHLRAKSFALLAYMVARRDRVLGKTELIEAIWPDVVVTEDSLTQAIRDLRRVLGDACIRTVPKRGYMLAASDGTDVDAMIADIAELPLVVVFYPECRALDTDDTVLVEALADEIIHALGRYGQVRVLARHTSARLSAGGQPPEAAAASVGADWFVTGVARRIAGSIRVSLSLHETASGQATWSDTLPLTVEGLTEAQIGLPHVIVTQITGRAERLARMKGSASGATDLAGWQHLMAGIAALRRYEAEANALARDHFLRAIEKAPDLALAHAYLGLAEIVIGRYDRAPSDVKSTALAKARAALDLSPDDARCHWILALILFWQHETGAAEATMRHAITLCPSDADIRVTYGFLLAMRGRAEEGIDWIRTGIRLNPFHPPWYEYDLAVACQIAGRFDETTALLARLPALNAWKETRFAAACAELGDEIGASRHLDLAEAAEPGWDAIAEAKAWREPEKTSIVEAFAAAVTRAVEMRDALRASALDRDRKARPQ